ncbi:MAG: TetR/AcrR family transcriptional regulator [Clostridia bacterium]|nr:TetR/AcrR family transcriptional regulator [Clostridia bacterium]
MAGNKMGDLTKEKILNAALGEFIEKGFDKAKVEDIAKQAGLTKVMLYYHFNSKENILSELLLRVLNEVKNKFQANMTNVDIHHPESFRAHIEIMIGFFLERKEVLRLITLEFIKGKNGNIGSLSILKELFSTILAFSDETDNISVDQQQFLTKVFFFNTLPMVMYSSLSDKFNEDFGFDAEKSKDFFIDTFVKTFYDSLSESKNL